MEEKKTQNIAPPLSESAPGGEVKGSFWLLFVINKTSYAIETRYVQEVHRNITPVRVPCSPDFIKGIVNIRGDICSATDLSLFLGFRPVQDRVDYLMIRLKFNKLEFGILVDEIEEIIYVEPGDIHPYVITGSNSSSDKYIKGITREKVNLVDSDALLKNEQLIVQIRYFESGPPLGELFKKGDFDEI